MNLNLDTFLKNKTLVFTVTSDGYKYFTWNLAKNLQTIEFPNPLCILCLDKESYDFFNRIALIPAKPFFLEGARIDHKTPALFGTTPFKRMTRMKLKALHELSQRSDIDRLIFLDSDIYVFQNFLPSFEEHFQQHFLWFQCDEARKGDYTCSDTSKCTNACTGVIGMNLTDESRPLLNTLYSISEKWKDALTDQDYVNTRLKDLEIPYKTLSRDKVPNGVFLSGDRYKEGNPLLVHFNHIVGMEKKRMMKNKNCWLLDV